MLGKFTVIMADPPWDIHMELPYGTMTDDEMKNMRIRELSDDGLFFLWVNITFFAMSLKVRIAENLALYYFLP